LDIVCNLYLVSLVPYGMPCNAIQILVILGVANNPGEGVVILAYASNPGEARLSRPTSNSMVTPRRICTFGYDAINGAS
jgi:hypothetical protein